MDQFRGTTILSVRRGGIVAVGGDGQVTVGDTVMKGNARKVRRLYDGKVLAGFAGGTADAFTLFERFEGKLEQYGNLTRAAIELAKDWRTDRMLRRLEALLCVADIGKSFIISGNGDVIEPENDLMAIGALSSANAAELDVPGDVSVVGFDGIAFGADVTPPLTTVSQSADEVVAHGAALYAGMLMADGGAAPKDPRAAFDALFKK